LLLEEGSCRAEKPVNVGCLNVTKLSFEVWLLFKLQSSGDSPGPQKIILRKHIEVLLKKQGAVLGARARPPERGAWSRAQLRPRGAASAVVSDFTRRSLQSNGELHGTDIACSLHRAPSKAMTHF